LPSYPPQPPRLEGDLIIIGTDTQGAVTMADTRSKASAAKAEPEVKPEDRSDEDLARSQFMVSAPLVNVRTFGLDGSPVVIARYAGAPVPQEADPEWIRHHLAHRLITEMPHGLGQPAPVDGGPESPKSDDPAGTPGTKAPEQVLQGGTPPSSGTASGSSSTSGSSSSRSSSK
jgi:hypothetical protein